MEIKRNVYKNIKKTLEKPEITIITGPRQCGKTTVIKAIEKELTEEGKKTLYLNLDIERDFEKVSSQEVLLQNIQLELGEDGYVFIDEIQRKENAGRFLKGIYDMGLKYKFVVTGSGSIGLKEKIEESLAGRKILIQMGTLSYDEFLNFRTGYRYEENLSEYLKIEEERAELFVKEYSSYGGYPAVVLEKTEEGKREKIAEIFQSYILKDIQILLDINKPEAFVKLVEYLALSSGKPLNYNDVLSSINISRPTLENYLYYLENTFLIARVRPFFTNKISEITKAEAIYFNDLGMLNFAKKEFNFDPNQFEVGFLFQAFAFCLIKDKLKDPLTRIKYWRTKVGNEIDFLLERAGEVIPIEVKYKRYNEVSISRGFRNFLQRYNPKRAYLLNLNLQKDLKVGNTNFSFITVQDILKGSVV